MLFLTTQQPLSKSMYCTVHICTYIHTAVHLYSNVIVTQVKSDKLNPVLSRQHVRYVKISCTVVRVDLVKSES